MDNPTTEGGATLAKRVPAKHRANLEVLTKAAIQRLAQKAGASYVSSTIYEKVRQVAWEFLHKVLERAVTYVKHDRRMTVSQEDLMMALEVVYKKPYLTGEEADVARCKVGNGKNKRGAEDCVHFSRAGFERLVRETAERLDGPVHFTANAVPTLQVATEAYLTELLEGVRLLAAHAGRQKITPEDLALLFKMPRRV